VLRIRPLKQLFSDATLTQKASLNALATSIDYAARWAVTFLITPVLVASLGDFRFGVWQVLGRLIGYLSPAGGRPDQVLKWTIATQQGSTDQAEKRRQVGSALVVWVLFFPLLSLLGAVLAWYTPSWLKAPPELVPSVRWATALLVADLILTNLAEIPRSVMRGENLGYKRMGLSTVLVLLGGALTALAVYANGGLIGMAGANVLTTALTGVMFVKVARSSVAWFGVAKPVLGSVRRFLGLSAWFLAWTLVMQLLRGADVVVLGILGSPELVTRYSLTRSIPETLIGFVAILVFGTTPGLGRIIGTRDFAKAARVREEMMIITWLMVTALSSTMLLWNRSFVQLWVRKADYYAGTIPNLLIALVVMQFVFIRNDANIIDLTLDLRKKVLVGLLSAGLSAGLSGVLVARFGLGIVGLALGFLAGQSVLSVAYPLIVGRFLGLSARAQLQGALRPASVSVLACGLLSALGDALVVRSWFVLVPVAGLTLISSSLLIFYTGLSAEQRARLWKRIRRAAPTG
jgi:O-antigen/teichoic acid export membrane protein